MTKNIVSLIAAATITMLPGWFSPAMAQEVPASAVSCHFVARAYFNFQSQPPTATVTGYITDTPGIGDIQKGQDSLFVITPSFPIPSEQNAVLTFRADTVVLGGVSPNGVVNSFQVSSGHFNIYYTANPTAIGRDWNNPNTFSNSLPFEQSKPVVALERDQSLAFATDILTRHDVTEHLISSRPFVLNGHTYDLGKFFPAGFTLYETYSNQSVGTTADWPTQILPGAGNCAAVAATTAQGENQQ